MDCLLLKVLVFGFLVNKLVIVCWICIFLIMFVVGVFLVEVFDFVGGVFGNVVFKDVIE